MITKMCQTMEEWNWVCDYSYVISSFLYPRLIESYI